MRFTSGLNPATSPAAAAVMTDTAVALNVAATPLSAPPAIKANTPLKKAADGFRATVASPTSSDCPPSPVPLSAR